MRCSVPILLGDCILRGKSGTYTLEWWGGIVLQGWSTDAVGSGFRSLAPQTRANVRMAP